MFKSLLKLIVWVVILACVFVGFCYYNTGKLPFGLDKYPFLRELATKLPVKAQKPNSPRGTNRAAHSPATTPSKLVYDIRFPHGENGDAVHGSDIDKGRTVNDRRR